MAGDTSLCDAPLKAAKDWYYDEAYQSVARHRKRGAIRSLQSYTDHHKGFGFAIMALCSLLIESLQSYRYGRRGQPLEKKHGPLKLSYPSWVHSLSDSMAVG